MRKHFGTLTSYWDPSNGYNRRWFIKKISEEGREEGKKENVMEIVDNFVLFKFKSKYPTDLQLAQTAACVSFAHKYGA